MLLERYEIVIEGLTGIAPSRFNSVDTGLLYPETISI
jgi:hypothetical protein